MVLLTRRYKRKADTHHRSNFSISTASSFVIHNSRFDTARTMQIKRVLCGAFIAVSLTCATSSVAGAATEDLALATGPVSNFTSGGNVLGRLVRRKKKPKPEPEQEDKLPWPEKTDEEINDVAYMLWQTAPWLLPFAGLFANHMPRPEVTAPAEWVEQHKNNKGMGLWPLQTVKVLLKGHNKTFDDFFPSYQEPESKKLQGRVHAKDLLNKRNVTVDAEKTKAILAMGQAYAKVNATTMVDRATCTSSFTDSNIDLILT
jgi:hypothetical protein